MSTGDKSKLSPKESLPVQEFTENPTIILSDQLCSQINYLHKVIGKKEWSGILLYSHKEGDISDPDNLVILAEEIYPMDIGSSASTEYTNDVDSILDLVDNYPRYESGELKIGHIHSHHNMRCYFSATDMDELQINSKSHNYYLSLIVNFEWNPVAKIATVGEIEQTKIRHKGAEGMVEKTLSSQEILGVYDCIVTENVNQNFRDRFSVVMKKKKEEDEKRKKAVKSYGGSYAYGWGLPEKTNPFQGQTRMGFDQPNFDSYFIETFVFNWINLDKNSSVRGGSEEAVATLELMDNELDRDDKDIYLEKLEENFEDYAIDLIGGGLYLTDDEYLKLVNELLGIFEPHESNKLVKDVVDLLDEYKEILTEAIKEFNDEYEGARHSV